MERALEQHGFLPARVITAPAALGAARLARAVRRGEEPLASWGQP